MPGGAVAGDDVYPAVERLLDATRQVTVVTGVLSVWLHDADRVAGFAESVEARHPGRFLAGFGVSHAPLVDREQEGLYRRPLAKMRQYLDELDAAPASLPAARRLLAALAPRMLELARDRALGAHPYFVPVEHTFFAREQLGTVPVLAVEQAVVLETDARAAREVARTHMAGYLKLPNYVNNSLLGHGFDEADVANGGSDRLVDAIVAWGDDEAIAARIAAHHEAGADHVCVQVIGPLEQHLPLEDWRRIAAASI